MVHEPIAHFDILQTIKFEKCIWYKLYKKDITKQNIPGRLQEPKQHN